MRILILRHGDPDYAHDSLTPQGKREAELLASRLAGEKIDAIYVSPLGRAALTASYTLAAKGMTGTTCEWLREFCGKSYHKNSLGEVELTNCWDYMPAEWTADPGMWTEEWYKNAASCIGTNVEEEYRFVTENLDALLERHGYKRDGKIYRAVRPNHDTIAFFCHFGVECILLSRLLNIPAPFLHQGTVGLPCSYTSVVTEERAEGIASFRMNVFGDVSHLTQAGLEPSFSARFCECFTDDTRKD